MTALRFVNHGISCNAPGCRNSLWGSYMGLRDGHTLRYIRNLAGKRGWVSRQAPPEKMDSYTTRTLDFCPSHALLSDAEPVP